jgi:hypothetical protein
MSSISRTQALEISHPDVLGSYLASNATDQLLPRIPKLPVVGDSLQTVKVAALATAEFVTSGGVANASATDYTSPARQFPLRRIPARVEVNGDIAQNVSMINDVFEQQIQAKMIGMWNAVGEKLIYGTGVDPEPAGLATLAAENPDSIDNGGANLSLSNLDALIQKFRPWDGDTPRAFVMNRGRYAKFSALCHASGFDPVVMPDPMLGRPVAHYLGVPVLVSDWINDTETDTTTSVYLVGLGTREGEPQYGGLVWFYNKDTGPGIRVDGPHRTSNTTDLLFSTLELNIGFASLSTGSVVRLSRVGLT